jgi:cbb3-type cytochrome oxidase subunit 3
MRLSDIMSRMGLHTYAEVALVIFFVVFVGIAIYVFSRRRRKHWDRARYMPLEDDKPLTGGEVDTEESFDPRERGEDR